MKKKINSSRVVTVTTLTGLAPFLMVWISWIMTAFSFNVHDAFQAPVFWFISGIYWLVWVCMAGAIIDSISD